MENKPILTFFDDKLVEISYLIACSSGVVIFFKIFLKMLNGSLFTSALKGEFAAIFILIIPLFMIVIFIFGSLFMFKNLFIDKSMKLYPEGFSFYDHLSQSSVAISWKLLESVNLKVNITEHNRHNYMNLIADSIPYLIKLDCLSSNPEDVSERMRSIYQHWKNDDFTKSNFEIPYYPNKLKNSQITYCLILIILCLTSIFWGIQNSEFLITYEGVEYFFSGISRFYLISAGVVFLLNILSQLIDHFDSHNNERQYRMFYKHSGILGCLLLHMLLITVLW